MTAASHSREVETRRLIGYAERSWGWAPTRDGRKILAWPGGPELTADLVAGHAFDAGPYSWVPGAGACAAAAAILRGRADMPAPSGGAQ